VTIVAIGLTSERVEAYRLTQLQPIARLVQAEWEAAGAVLPFRNWSGEAGS